MITKTHSLPVKKQSELLDISRSSVYYADAPTSERDLAMMKDIYKLHMELPFYGSRRLNDELLDFGHIVGRDHVRTLMKKMGIEAIYRKKKTSVPGNGHKIYPYLLRGMNIDKAGMVWCADITYLPMRRGFCYLVAIMDWASRKVLSWRLSNTLDTSFCVDALNEALIRYKKPEIFNTDQGAQFTSKEFTGILQESGIRISMDGVGRWIDNVFIERLWRTVKYEEVYLKAYDGVIEARKELKNYFRLYNTRRKHQSLGKRTPDTVYWETLPSRELAV